MTLGAFYFPPVQKSELQNLHRKLLWKQTQHLTTLFTTIIFVKAVRIFGLGLLLIILSSDFCLNGSWVWKAKYSLFSEVVTHIWPFSAAFLLVDRNKENVMATLFFPHSFEVTNYIAYIAPFITTLSLQKVRKYAGCCTHIHIYATLQLSAIYPPSL